MICKAILVPDGADRQTDRNLASATKHREVKITGSRSTSENGKCIA